MRYDSAQDVYFVSNVNGNPSRKDGNGSIARVDAATRAVTMLAEGGKNGVTLNAPKGLAIVGGTLWVADIDVVRGFDTHTGKMVKTVDLSKQGAKLLNDVAAGADSALYITDTGVAFGANGEMTHPGPDRIFRVGPDQQVSIALEGAMLAGPNGITFDAATNRFLLAPLMASAISTWHPGDAHPDSIAAGPGQFDGIEVLSTGQIIV